MSRALFMPFAVGLAALGGWLATQSGGMVATCVAVAVALLVVFAGRPRLVVWVAGAGVLVTQGQWPIVAAVGGADLYLGDLLALVALAASVAQTRVRPVWRFAAGVVLLLGAWAVLRSDNLGQVAFGRILLPLIVLLAVARLPPDGYDLRRDLRWFPIAVLGSVPILGGDALSRWSSIAGGANETGLIAAVSVVLGFTYRGAWRFTLWAVGLVLLVGTAAITATVATAAALVYYAAARRPDHRRLLGSGSPLLVAVGIGLAVIAVPILRVDLYGTIDAHLFQISKLDRVLASGDVIFGSGWANTDRAAFFNSDISGLHNVYLDVLAQVGVVGLGLLAVLLVATWRRTDVVGRALLVTWAVWVNTTGAFPGAAWGVLGFVLAFAALTQMRSDEPAGPSGSDGEGPEPALYRVGVHADHVLGGAAHGRE